MASEIIEVLNAGRALECPLVPTRHARARMAERAITMDELQRTRMYGTVTRVRNGSRLCESSPQDSKRRDQVHGVAALGLRVVNLQHDGIVVRGVVEGRHRDVAKVMSEAVTHGSVRV